MCKTCIFVDLCVSQRCEDYVGDPWKTDDTELLEEEHVKTD